MDLHHLSATELRDLLQRGETTSSHIVEALIARRKAVDPQVRAFVVELDEQARARAQECDAERKAGTARGVLHGLPITIKENIDVRGLDSTMGLAHRRGKPASCDAVTVRVLREQGAIVLGKTNVPQLLLAQETENAVWGITHNPWNLGRSPGGSSGGEASAIASGQSPFGIGTDIGGSIRIPAHFCGIAGLKPTVDRWSNRGSATGIAGQELVRAQMGPMARTVADLDLLMQAVDPRLSSLGDPAVPPLPYGGMQSVDLRGLRIGLFDDDGFLRANPALRRAVRRAGELLTQAGATVVQFTPPEPELMYVWLAGISADGGKTLERSLGRDAVVRQLKDTMRIAHMPGPLKAVVGKVLAARGEKRLAKLFGVLGEKPVADYWSLTDRRTQLRRREFDMWNELGLDAVLCPPHTIPAMPLGTSGDLTLTLSYAFRYVMLNFPAGVVPVTRVRSDEEVRENPADRLERRTAECEIGAAGLPVGVQVVARPYREDLVLALMAAIEAGARGDALYPATPVDPA